MSKYLGNEFNIFLLGLFVMLVLGKLFGRWAKNIGFAEITGEIIAGIILGPTLLGALNIDFYQLFFSQSNGSFFNIFSQLCLVLLMFVTGLKINIAEATSHLRKTFYITFFGILFPFITGVLVAWLFQDVFLDPESKQSFSVLALFMGIAYSISALPVIAKILMDIKILNTPVGAIIISTALLVDIIGWGFFTVITQFQSENPNGFLILLGSFIILYILKMMLTLLFKRLNSNVLNSDVSLSIGICLLFSIIFQFLHLEACLGAFMAGIILNNILNSQEIKNTLSNWVMNFFAPIFFVSIGVKIDFLNNFNWILVVIIFVTACISKIAGSYIGAHLSGIKGNDRTLISLALNARGTIEIVFSTVALNLGIISNPTYVALITMALLSSIMAGVLIKRIVYPCEHRGLVTNLEPQISLIH